MQNAKFNHQALLNAWEKSNIAVIDSMPGSGKTSAVTQYLKETKANYVLFASPFLSDVEDALPNDKLKGLGYVYPKQGYKGKINHLKDLLRMGNTKYGTRLHRITCTHTAFCNLPSESYNHLKQYTVIIDETLNVIDTLIDVRLQTEAMLLGIGQVNQNKRYTYDDIAAADKLFQILETDHQGQYLNDRNYHLMHQAYLNQLIQYSKGNWFRTLPDQLLKYPQRVLIMTHGFQNSYMHCWMKMQDIEHSTVDNNLLGLRSESALKAQLKDNLKLIEHSREFRSINAENPHAFSKSHWDELKSSNSTVDIAKSLNHIIKERMQAKSDNVFWTCPKAHKSDIQQHSTLLRGKIKLSKPLEVAETDFNLDNEQEDENDLTEKISQTLEHSSWLPCNIKARNDFRHVSNCVYAFNLNCNPAVLNLLTNLSGLDKEQIQKTFKLNNLLQFIYRGSIRENQPMNLYIASDAMKQALTDFLDH